MKTTFKRIYIYHLFANYGLDKMITGGYVKTIEGSYHLEFRNKKRERMVSKKYSSLQSLKRSYPKIIKALLDVENYKKRVYENDSSIVACFAPKLVAYTSTFKDIKSAIDFVKEVRSFVSDEENASKILSVCLLDESGSVVRIKKVSQFLDELEKISLPSSSMFYFRGHSSYLYKMEPGIYRKPDLINNEDVIYNELLVRCPGDFAHTASTFEILVKMQHYSLPTRLLDITTNPLIALYFACSSYKTDSYDGEVKILNIPTDEVKYFDSDAVTVISNIAKQKRTFSTACLDTENDKLIHFMDDIKREKSYFVNRIKKATLTSVVCVKPKLNNARIIRQDGAFLIFGMKSDKSKPAAIPSKYQLENGTRFFIDKKSKESILAQLEKIGINEATIYPEIDKVSTYVSNRYGKPVDLRDEQDEVIENHKKDSGSSI
ncbi:MULTISPECIES: FRG domain-containing protein [Klebsiella pneumoniae complex]|uniref:FRG domain-containing protein n=2 Tax=Klebsiella pneumoniae complex TaxID=3390273 RepID=UPI001157359B|nr:MULTISPECIES: FRG domain-containing protein [Klebsiella]MCJ5285556.1 FRG domain-containing protein [Klebsiella variicola]MCJ5307344.1 FRG domain-containing protein [Klebsiella variicola]MDZ3703828.1 FRG domain-containing protein [Klebsiella variicola]HDS2392640.1 FRG domain-containing protein [Klebsiella pneumoniae]